MPIYFGFPVTCQEAFRLCNLDYEQAKCDIMQKYKLSENRFMDCHSLEYMNNFFRGKNVVMRLFYTDKGQCIIGYKIENVSVFTRKFVKVSEFTDMLNDLMTRFWCEIEILNCRENFNKIVLEHMEDEPETVEGAEPYIIEFND